MKIAFLNPQGNFDPLDSHWTDHPDFGGQLVYVKELAIAMASYGVNVDIVTRRIVDKHWPEFSTPFDYYPGISGVRIVRINFGGTEFLPKEKLWKCLKDYVVGIEKLYVRERTFPDFITGHYGDGGLSAAMLAKKEKSPFLSQLIPWVLKKWISWELQLRISKQLTRLIVFHTVSPPKGFQ